MAGCVQDGVVKLLQTYLDIPLLKPMNRRAQFKAFGKNRLFRLNLSKILFTIIFLNIIGGIILLTKYHSDSEYQAYAVEMDVMDMKHFHMDRITLTESRKKRDIESKDAYKQSLSSTAFDGSPLITLFTTFKVVESREQLNKNTLRLWASLRPAVRPVLFSTPEDDAVFLHDAKELGWLIYKAPSLKRGYPIVRDMFTFVINNVRPASLFVGYANSDIVFTDDLNKTLTYLSHIKWQDVDGEGLLLVGKRSDIYVNQLVQQNGPITSAFLATLRDEREYGGSHSLDYFITAANGYPWYSIPDFVVGKPGYDNYLVVKALDWNIRTVDCTKTITALHQITGIPNFDGGWFSNNTCMNRALVDPFFPNRGATHCTQYLTKTREKSIAGGVSLTEPFITLYRREKRFWSCLDEPAVLLYPRYKTCEQIVEAKRIEMQKALENEIH